MIVVVRRAWCSTAWASGANTAHLVAESIEDARAQWVTVFSRDRADLGPAHAAQVAAEDIDRYGTLARNQSAALKPLP
jgi:exodeoxyribonuclease V alpha subunit